MRFSKHRLATIFAATSLLGAPAAPATTTDNTPSAVTINNMPTRDSAYLLRFNDFPTIEQMRAFIASRDNIKIQERTFNNYDELHDAITSGQTPFFCAFFSPIHRDITINFLRATNGGLDAPIGRNASRGTLDDQINEMVRFNNFLNDFNDGMPGLVQHELWHQRNDSVAQLYGLRFDQIIGVHVHDELSCTVSEMLFRRKIYMNTKSIATAFRGVGAGSLRSNGNRRGPFHKYENFLRQNKESLTRDITPAEADLMLEVATDCFTDIREQIAVNVGNVLRYRTAKLYQTYIAGGNAGRASAGYDSAVRKIYSFENVHLLDICSDAARARLDAFAHNFAGDEILNANLANFRPVYEPEIDAIIGRDFER
jgi:hypothetical protein